MKKTIGYFKNQLRQGHNKLVVRHWKLPLGVTYLRLMPDVATGEFFRRCVEIWLPHGDGSGRRMRLVSQRTVDPTAYCPAEETSRMLYQMGRLEDAAVIRPNERFLVNALVRDNTTGSWDQRTVRLPYEVYSQIIDLVVSYNEEALQDAKKPVTEDAECSDAIITDPQQGRILKVRAKQEHRRKYTVELMDKTKPLTKQHLDNRIDFSSECVPSPNEAIEEAICAYLGVGNMDEVAMLGEQSKKRMRASRTTRVVSGDGDGSRGDVSVSAGRTGLDARNESESWEGEADDEEDIF